MEACRSLEDGVDSWRESLSKIQSFREVYAITAEQALTVAADMTRVLVHRDLSAGGDLIVGIHGEFGLCLIMLRCASDDAVLATKHATLGGLGISSVERTGQSNNVLRFPARARPEVHSEYSL